MAEHRGGCYCGNISVTVKTEQPLLASAPRACDCDFCRMNGITWASVSDAVLEIEIQNEAAINLFEQGSDTARFWLCQRCGVVPAVTADIDGHRKGAVNANCMLDHERFPKAVPVSPKTLDADQKKARWSDVWIDKVVIKDCWDVGL